MSTTTCETCEGTGQCMSMVCYGGPPLEVMDTCPDCDGTGEVEVAATPAPPMNSYQAWLAVRAQIEGRE